MIGLVPQNPLMSFMSAMVPTLVGATSTSQVIDIALDRLVRAEKLRRDIQAYRRVPQTQDERALAAFVDTTGLSDDTDWEALYAAETT